MIWTARHIRLVRFARRERWKVAETVRLFPDATRDEVIEAIDACLRHQNDDLALRHLQHVLEAQADGLFLINGRPASRYEPMF